MRLLAHLILNLVGHATLAEAANVPDKSFAARANAMLQLLFLPLILKPKLRAFASVRCILKPSHSTRRQCQGSSTHNSAVDSSQFVRAVAHPAVATPGGCLLFD